MDINAAWVQLQGAIHAGGDRAEVAELADGIIGWLEKGGFTPSCAVLERPFLAMGRKGLIAHLRALRTVAEMA